ncbi:unnamed protein product, partial [Brenthis ino]
MMMKRTISLAQLAKKLRPALSTTAEEFIDVHNSIAIYAPATEDIVQEVQEDNDGQKETEKERTIYRADFE